MNAAISFQNAVSLSIELAELQNISLNHIKCNWHNTACNDFRYILHSPFIGWHLLLPLLALALSRRRLFNSGKISHGFEVGLTEELCSYGQIYVEPHLEYGPGLRNYRIPQSLRLPRRQ